MSSSDVLTLSVKRSGEFLVFRTNEYYAGGNFVAASGHMSVYVVECDSASRPALYDWTVQEDILAFKPIGPDDCAERRQLLSQTFEFRLDLR